MIIKHSIYDINLLLILVFIVSCAFGINGCTVAGPVGVSMAIGSAYLSKERAQIRVTEDERDTEGCEFIKHVKASTSWGGMAFQDKALEKTVSDLTHESFEAGANLLLVRSKDKTFNGSKSEGDAYRCPCLDSESTSEGQADELKEEEGEKPYRH